MKLALDASAPMMQSENLRRWLLLEDDVLFRQATITMGLPELTALAKEYAENEAFFEAAKATFAQSNLTADINVSCVLMANTLALLERDGLPTREAQQFKWTVCGRYGYHAATIIADKPEEVARIKAMMDELSKDTALRKDPFAEVMALVGTLIYMLFQLPFAWNGGRVMTDDGIYEGFVFLYETGAPYAKRTIEQAIGARREWHEMTKNLMLLATGTPASGHTTAKNVAYVRAVTDAEWGEDNEKLVDSLLCFNFKRHHEIGRSSALTHSLIFFMHQYYVAEKNGNLKQLLDVFNHQCHNAEAYVSAIEPFSADSNLEEWHWWVPSVVVDPDPYIY
jgi:hypothetical protein